VVLAQLVGPHRSLFLASADGHVIHFPVDEVNILAGVGKGVMGIKLEEGDACLGGALIRNQNDALVVETSGGRTMEFHGSREQTGRGGKGFEAVKRSSFMRVVPPAIELVDWDKVEGKGEGNGNGKPNGDQRTLFE
jgi:DNA gyrase/topoisomerase IV subunit A